jgi:hypothetical protein
LESFAALKVYNLSSTCILESWTKWRCKESMQTVSVQCKQSALSTWVELVAQTKDVASTPRCANKRCCIEQSALNAGQTKDSIELEMQTKAVASTGHHPNRKQCCNQKTALSWRGKQNTA